ncbi:cytochrome P450 family protein [Mycobacteroides abscessus]|uniref:hypothetical protein n=1 Tax=Mycobacteroides abscessus TaxID=36809 RepID=UPI0009A712E6|nr:hypothetical protein [Mycobacteroides abscessus]
MTALDGFREEPIWWSPAYGGFWFLTRYADMRKVLIDSENFSNAKATIPDREGWREGIIPNGIDPPQHGTYRRILVPLFTRHVIAPVFDALQVECDRLVKSFASAGHCDLVSEFSRPLQNALLSMLLGGAGDHPRFNRWAEGLFGAHDKTRRTEAAADMALFVAELVERRDNPAVDRRGGLIAHLTQTQIDGRFLNSTEIHSITLGITEASLTTVRELDCSELLLPR